MQLGFFLTFSFVDRLGGPLKILMIQSYRFTCLNESYFYVYWFHLFYQTKYIILSEILLIAYCSINFVFPKVALYKFLFSSLSFKIFVLLHLAVPKLRVILWMDFSTAGR